MTHLSVLRPPSEAKPVPQKKPAKQRKRNDFPLWVHGGRQVWCRKVRGKHHYFGKVADDPKGEAALNLWLEQRDDLLAGRTPRVKTDELSIADLCNRFLTAKADLRDSGEITIRHWANYKRTTDKLVAQFGKTRLVIDLESDDFEALRRTLADGVGPVALGNAIQHVRIVFKYAWDAGLIEHPVRFGPLFKRPSRKVLRLAKAKQGAKLFEAADIQRMLKAATPQLKAMVLLAINCGFGNNDCATLPLSAIDLDRKRIRFSRPKTGVERRCPLWKETIDALQAVLAKRKTPKDPQHAGLVFITAALGSFAKDTSDNPIAKEFAKLLKELSLTQKGRGFYSLRHTFRTVADETRDFPACDLIMGHSRDDMASVYRERIDDARLEKVVEHVRKWLNAKATKPASRKAVR